MSKGRYESLINNSGKLSNFPKVLIDKRNTDKFIVYNSSKTRLDRIAFSTYQNDDYWWIILLGNPQYYCEFDIPPNSVIRIPFPLQDVLSEIINKISSNKNKD